MKVLVLSVHPDDETLGCGATLLRHKDQGDELHWLIVTEPSTPQWTQEIINRKTAEIESVADTFNMKSVHRLHMPTVRLDTLPLFELIEGIRKVIEQVHPNVVYMIHGGDIHTDHHVVFTAALSVLRPSYMQRWSVQRMLCYEILSSTEAAPPQFQRLFIPNVYNDITQYIERKIEIMALYETEIQADPFPRGPSAIRALARYRGATIGVEYAEAFMLIRELM